MIAFTFIYLSIFIHKYNKPYNLQILNINFWYVLIYLLYLIFYAIRYIIFRAGHKQEQPELLHRASSLLGPLTFCYTFVMQLFCWIISILRDGKANSMLCPRSWFNASCLHFFLIIFIYLNYSCLHFFFFFFSLLHNIYCSFTNYCQRRSLQEMHWKYGLNSPIYTKLRENKNVGFLF